ncbi:metal-dependent hydrolase, partial [Natronoarchaeum mannanilyticum]
MMATTHALWGMALALPVLALAPEFAPVAFGAGLVAGLFPDLDLYAGHRRTFHFPVYASLAAVPAIALAIVAPLPWTVAFAAGL